MGNLTKKQENFCNAFIETGNASEAYRIAYNTKNMKPETVRRKAKEVMDNGNVTARVAELKKQHAKRHNIAVDDLLDELEENRQLALQGGQAAAANGATMGKAKLLGFDKQVIEHTHKVVDDGSHEW